MPIDQIRNRQGFQILGRETVTIVVSRGPPEGLVEVATGR